MSFIKLNILTQHVISYRGSQNIARELASGPLGVNAGCSLKHLRNSLLEHINVLTLILMGGF